MRRESSMSAMLTDAEIDNWVHNDMGLAQQMLAQEALRFIDAVEDESTDEFNIGEMKLLAHNYARLLDERYKKRAN